MQPRRSSIRGGSRSPIAAVELFRLPCASAPATCLQGGTKEACQSDRTQVTLDRCERGVALAILKRASTLFLSVLPTPFVVMFSVEDDTCPAAPTVLPRDLRLFVADGEIAELVQLHVSAHDLAVRRGDIAGFGSIAASMSWTYSYGVRSSTIIPIVGPPWNRSPSAFRLKTVSTAAGRAPACRGSCGSVDTTPRGWQARCRPCRGSGARWRALPVSFGWSRARGSPQRRRGRLG